MPQTLWLLRGRCTIKSYTRIKDRNPFSAVSWEVSKAFAWAKRSVVPAASATLLSPDTSNRVATWYLTTNHNLRGSESERRTLRENFSLHLMFSKLLRNELLLLSCRLADFYWQKVTWHFQRTSKLHSWSLCNCVLTDSPLQSGLVC